MPNSGFLTAQSLTSLDAEFEYQIYSNTPVYEELLSLAADGFNQSGVRRFYLIQPVPTGFEVLLCDYDPTNRQVVAVGNPLLVELDNSWVDKWLFEFISDYRPSLARIGFNQESQSYQLEVSWVPAWSYPKSLIWGVLVGLFFTVVLHGMFEDLVTYLDRNFPGWW